MFASVKSIRVNKSLLPMVVMGLIYFLLIVSRMFSDSASAESTCEGAQGSFTSSHTKTHDPQLQIGQCGVPLAVMKNFLKIPQSSLLSVTQMLSPLPSAVVSTTGNPTALSSRPSSTRKIYLDFNGFTISSDNTAWYSFWNGRGKTGLLRGLSFDSDYTSFSAAENTYIQNVWRAVSEDFSALDVDVTTIDPGASGLSRSSLSDTSFGVHAVVSDNYTWANVCCGGVAYVGVADWTYSNQLDYRTNFNFMSFSSGSYLTPADAAGIISHETGHNLGLGHDGNSSTEYYGGHSNGLWGPIMGTTYSQAISQWSKNEYTGGRVSSTTDRGYPSLYKSASECTANTDCRDDFLVFTENSIPLAVDDFGSTKEQSYLINSSAFSIDGLIGPNADEDFFKIVLNSNSKLSVNADPVANIMNLDIELSLINASGTVLKTINPVASRKTDGTPAGMSASLSNETLTTGTYYLRVRGTGALDPLSTGYSNYASVGRFTLAGQIVGGPKTLQTITFDAPTSIAPGAGATTLTATASSGLSVSFATTTPAVCTISGSTLTPVGQGTCSVTASQAGNDTYGPARDVRKSVKVVGG